MKKQFLILLVTVLAITRNSYGQPNMNPDSLTIKAMDKVSFLTGDWTGGYFGLTVPHFSVEMVPL
jgi:hypothetical protein